MMVNLLDDSNFDRQTAVMTQLIEMIIKSPVFGIFCITSMLAHPTSQYLTSFTNIQKSTECTFYAVNDNFGTSVSNSDTLKTCQQIHYYLEINKILIIRRIVRGD